MSSGTIDKPGEQKDALQSEKRKREEHPDDENIADGSLSQCEVKEPEAKNINSPRVCDDCDSEGEGEERKCKHPKSSDDENDEIQVCGNCDIALCKYHASLHKDTGGEGMEWCEACSEYTCHLCRMRFNNEHMHCPGCGEELEDDRDKDEFFCSECK